MIRGIQDFKNVFFIGVAGVGMSAIAQYLAGIDKKVSGSDRYFKEGEFNDTKEKLEAAGIHCFLQNGDGITHETDLVVVSTAIEDTVFEVQKAKQLNIPIIKRSELLALIAKSKRTIAVGGTSGKSTTSAMLFDILDKAGLQPSIISGAGLVSIIKEGKIGNAKVGAGEWLVIEADESDGSIVQYEPEIGLLLNVDKDHQEIDELMGIFTIFKNNSKIFIVNQSNALAKQLSQNMAQDFSSDENSQAGFIATDFSQDGFCIQFTIHNSPFTINSIGKHNMENALAAVAVANQIGVDLETCASALKNYEGIYRRNQVLGNKNGIWVIDDYAHNPVKCAAAIMACQPVADKVVAWFQPHGYGPTRFLRTDFVKEIAAALRPQDEIWMSEIFYAGGTAVKDISANDLIMDIKALGKNAFFVEDRNLFVETARPHLSDNSVLLLMGARDPGLEAFSRSVFESL
ncbi:MAG: UDP-N-acetylmuramate--alanine ligase [Chitinophagaceae bacterium]|nr:UDP-N-acetylmuramate--alanine ligase [Chitinophagaceae bacterium]MBK7306081.1 UDP-N-acetylmuramate--alanine ligase [Chitinophagaceae bacterium]MBK8787105.1 UDP-N-acetylmuramate--alanine ligase [Chitinophagaceae bacterium]MBL0201045.1 UDP-N-acetylmuramate--alanine ligase [Chitinophagaceae bacterium]